MRTIYFCGSIRAGRQDVELYARMIGKLDSYGKVLTPFVGDSTITVKGSEHSGGDKGIHDRDVELLEKSDGKHRYSVSSSSHFSFTLLVSVILLLLPNFLSGGRNSLFCKKNFCNKMETSVNQQLFFCYVYTDGRRNRGNLDKTGIKVALPTPRLFGNHSKSLISRVEFLYNFTYLLTPKIFGEISWNFVWGREQFNSL